MKKKIFYSHNQEALDAWLKDNKGKIEVVGMGRSRPKTLRQATVDEITVYYKEIG